MSARVTKKPRAKRDLLEHFYFIGAEQPEAAERFLDECERAFEGLADWPKTGRLLEMNHHRLKGIRVWPVRGFTKYLVIFRAVADGIEVLRVLHGARDWERVLREEEID